MIIRLNGKEIVIDKDEVFKNPRKEAIDWLRERKENNGDESLFLQTHGDAVRPQFEEAQESDHALRDLPLA